MPGLDPLGDPLLPRMKILAMVLLQCRCVVVAVKVKLYFMAPDDSDEDKLSDELVSSVSSRASVSDSSDEAANMIVFNSRNDPEELLSSVDDDSLSDTDDDDDDDAAWSQA